MINKLNALLLTVALGGGSCSMAMESEKTQFLSFCKIDIEKNSMQINDGIKEIPDYEFDNIYYRYEAISKVKFPSGLQKLGARSFIATNVTSIDLPEGTQSIGEACFAFCRNLDIVMIPTTLVNVGQRAFQHVTADVILKVAQNETRKFSTLSDYYKQLITNAGGSIERMYIKNGSDWYLLDADNNFFEQVDGILNDM